MSDLITVQKASFGYNRTPVLRDVTLTVRANEFIGIIGPNGAGKTTLFRGLVGLLRPLKGKTRRALELVHRIGYVPQRDDLDAIYPLTARDVVAMGLVASVPWYRFRTTESLRRVSGSLDQVGMLAQADASFADLSGGQRQRVLLARALVIDPTLMVLDEPTAGIDAQAEENILKLLQAQHARGKTILMVSHRDESLRHYATRVLQVDDQKVSEVS